jgi:hypothetical protein
MANNNLPAHFPTKFDTMVRKDYGYIGQLNFDMFYTKDANDADGAYFNKQGLFYSHRYVYNSATPLTGVDKSRIKIMLEWYSTEYFIDQVEQLMLNYQDQMYAIEGTKDAIGRRKDDVILKAITNTQTTQIVPKTASGVAAGLSLSSLMMAAAMLNKSHVPFQDRIIICSSDQVANLLKDPKVVSSDYNTVKALVNGQIDSFYGFKFIIIDPFEAAKGVPSGIPVDIINQETYAYAFVARGMKCPIGVVYNNNMMIDIAEKVPTYNFGTLIQAKIGLGAQEIDPKGIVKIVCASDVFPAINPEGVLLYKEVY